MSAENNNDSTAASTTKLSLLDDDDDYERNIAPILRNHKNTESALTCVQATYSGEVYPRGSHCHRQFGLVLIHNNNHYHKIHSNYPYHNKNSKKAEDSCDTATADELTLTLTLRKDPGLDAATKPPDLIYYVCQKQPWSMKTMPWGAQSLLHSEECYSIVRQLAQLYRVRSCQEYYRGEFPLLGIEVCTWENMGPENRPHLGLANIIVPIESVHYPLRGIHRRLLNSTPCISHAPIAVFFGAELIKESSEVVVPRVSSTSTTTTTMHSSHRITERFLHDVCQHTRLTELRLKSQKRDDTTTSSLSMIQMVADILCLSDNVIHHLVLDHFHVNREWMQCLLDGLQHKHAVVTALSMLHCEFTDVATEMFTTFIQSITKKDSSLRELYLAGHPRLFGSSTTMGRTAANMITTGSELEALTLEGHSNDVDVRGFCESLVNDNNKAIQLSSWTLIGCGGSANILAQYLPQLDLKTLNWYYLPETKL